MNQGKLVSTIIVFYSVMIIPEISYSQTLSWGVKGGMNVSWVTGTFIGEIRSKPGLNVYSFADLNTSENFSVSFESGYTQKGFETMYEYYAGPVKTSYTGIIKANLNYIDISVLAKIKLLKGKVIPYLIAGPSMGVKINEGTSEEPTSETAQLTGFKKMLEEMKTVTAGLKAGAGVEMKTGRDISVIFEAGCNFDLSTSFDAPDGLRLGVETWEYSENVKNKVFEISAGVKF